MGFWLPIGFSNFKILKFFCRFNFPNFWGSWKPEAERFAFLFHKNGKLEVGTYSRKKSQKQPIKTMSAVANVFSFHSLDKKNIDNKSYNDSMQLTVHGKKIKTGFFCFYFHYYEWNYYSIIDKELFNLLTYFTILVPNFKVNSHTRH